MRKKFKIGLMSLAMMFVLSFGLVGCATTKPIDDDAVLTQGFFQKEPTTKYMTEQGLKGELEPVKVGAGKGADALKAVNAAIANESKLKEYAWFVVTKTNITVNLEKEQMGGKVFNVQQRSTYANANDKNGSYSQTVSGMQELVVGGLNLSSITGSFGYVTRSYNTPTMHYRSGGGGPSFKDVNKLAGATAKWKKTERNEVKPPVPADPNAPAPDYSKDPNYVLDPATGEYVTFVTDYNWGKGNTTGGKFAKYSKKLPWGSPQYQSDKKTLDMTSSTIVKEGKYMIATFNYKEDQVDFACRYAKAALVSDINPFVAPWDMKYTFLTQTYEIWNNGLLKKISRQEKFTTEADAILVGRGAGFAENFADQVYSYSEKDYNTDKYTNAKAWKDRV